MKAKRTTTLNGILMGPLAVGHCALILHDGRFTRTSRVVEIHEAEHDEVRFETMNTIYRLLLPGPAPQAAEQQVLCMAA